MGGRGDRAKRHGDVIARERMGFGLRCLVVSEAIGRRNVAIEPDNQTGVDCRTGRPGERFLSALLRLAYHVVLQRITGQPDRYR